MTKLTLHTPTRRLAAYALGLTLLLGALEVLVRSNEQVFDAASHRALTKVALLERHPQVAVLFLGTSRTADGVAPRLFSAELGALHPDRPPAGAFNGAFTSSSLKILELLAPRFAARPGLQLVVIELSDPQLTNDTPLWGSSSASAAESDVEGTLARLARDHVRLVAHRTALFSDNLWRVLALAVFAPALDGSEVKTVDQLAAWLGRFEKRAESYDAQEWAPRLIGGETEVALDAAQSARVERVAAIAGLFQKAGARVVFAVPPLAREHNGPERTEAMQALFAAIARRTGNDVWDWTAAPVPAAAFNGTSHLGRSGRAQYSRALAEQVAATGALARSPAATATSIEVAH